MKYNIKSDVNIGANTGSIHTIIGTTRLTGSLYQSGSLIITGGTLVGTASNALTSSYSNYSITASYALTGGTGNNLVFVKAYATSSNVIITIPSASSIPEKLYIIKADGLVSGNIIVTGSGQLIDTYENFTLSIPYGYVWIYSDGTELHIVNY